MKATLQEILAVFGTPLQIKTPSCGWKHDDQRLTRADQKRLRKNAARLRNKRD